MDPYDSGSTTSLSDEDIVPCSKKMRPSENAESFHLLQNPDEPDVIFDEKATNMMLNMGYRQGFGLGKHNQGRKEIVAISNQKGRRGLGISYKDEKNLEVAGWDFNKEKVLTIEEIKWLDICTLQPPKLSEMKTWIEYGEPLLTLVNCVNFVDREVIEDVNSGKNSLDNIDRKDLLSGRSRSNPFELIKSGIFLNRAAMKMANIDQRLEFMFTNPRDCSGETLFDDEDSILYFADICAGPGGFSEYILWRMKTNRERFAHGFGFTLKESNDFKLYNFFAGPSECFEPFYGEDNDGDIFKPHNLVSFRDFVMRRTDGKGVYFTMADGGFSVEENRNNQEILSKQLYLCQCLCALMITREDGNFVTKLFDLFSNFSIGLIYLMRRAFYQVAIIKPITSRPANSERYLVCKNKRPDSNEICDYLFEVNKQISCKRLNQDILDIVPLHLLKDTPEFYDYIRESNYKSLTEGRQNQIKSDCFRLWSVPGDSRFNPSSEKPEHLFEKYCQIKIQWEEDVKGTYNKAVEHRLNYRCFPVSNAENVKFYLSVGKVYTFVKDEWRILEKKDRHKIQLPYGTIVLAEEVEEICILPNRKQIKQPTLYIYDALVLNTKDVSNLDFVNRRDITKNFVKAISMEAENIIKFRVSEMIILKREILDYVELIKLQWEGIPCRCFKNLDETFYKTKSVMFLKITNHPWNIEFSAKSNKIYYYNPFTKRSSFEINKYIAKQFINSTNKRSFLKWESNYDQLSMVALEKVVVIN